MQKLTAIKKKSKMRKYFYLDFAKLQKYFHFPQKKIVIYCFIDSLT